jgi:hypothetical protein
LRETGRSSRGVFGKRLSGLARPINHQPIVIGEALDADRVLIPLALILGLHAPSAGFVASAVCCRTP